MHPLYLLCSVLALNGLLMLFLLLGRYYGDAQARQQVKFVQTWKPVLLSVSVARGVPLPGLKKHQRLMFLLLWNDLQQQLQGQANLRLNQLLAKLDLQTYCCSLLKSRSVRKQLVGSQVFSQLKAQPEAWPLLLKLTLSGNETVTFFALQAMVKMSPQAALPVLLHVLQQGRISTSRLLGLIRRYPEAQWVKPLLEHLQHALYSHQLELALQIIELLTLLPYPDILPTIRQVLVEAQEPRLLISCLEVMKTLKDPWIAQLVPVYLQHENWKVRQMAAATLGCIAGAEQIPLLIHALDDPHQWVSFAAAQGLLAIPGIRREKLESLGPQLSKPHARQILQLLLNQTSELTQHV